MASNSRFATAIHTLGVLAYIGESSVSSDMIAESVDTNPVVIRRIIQKMARHGIVEVQMGTGGGSRLTRPPQEISLAEIYAALDEDALFNSPVLDEERSCPIGRTVRPVLQTIFDEAETKLTSWLENVMLSDVMERVAECLQKEKSKTGK